MFPSGLESKSGQPSLPHGRGDVSKEVHEKSASRKSSPRAWGCFHQSKFSGRWFRVFPTGVGMFLDALNKATKETSLPHGRGDVSKKVSPYVVVFRSSPRAWGCFRRRNRACPWGFVFPTGVGMFLDTLTLKGDPTGLPHGRGDVSKAEMTHALSVASSPRAWGCFPLGLRQEAFRGVFPTGVGMFPRSMITSPNWSSFPHERGDVFDSANCGSFDCQVLPWDKKSFWCFVKGE